MEGVGQDLFPPPGYANSTTPLFATPVCGSILQTEVVSTVGMDAVFVPFSTPQSWSSVTAWTSDVSGIIWTCQIAGIYSMNISQTLSVLNAADITNPVVNMTMSIADPVNTELDQEYTTSIIVPVTISPILVSTGVTNIVNANVGTTMEFGIASASGDIDVTSGGNAGYYQAFTYNLIAKGVYGNVVV